jgi:hypothetical protein
MAEELSRLRKLGVNEDTLMNVYGDDYTPPGAAEDDEDENQDDEEPAAHSQQPEHGQEQEQGQRQEALVQYQTSSTPASSAPFWGAGSVPASDTEIHPRNLHANAMLHKWALVSDRARSIDRLTNLLTRGRLRSFWTIRWQSRAVAPAS